MISGTEGANLEDKFLLHDFTAFSINEMERKATKSHVFFKMVREVEVSRDWFGSVFIVKMGSQEQVRLNHS